MTQEFRTFTQRLTDRPNATTRIFNVRAKTIVDRFGNDVVDAEGNKIWFPENFDPAAAIAFGKSLVSDSTLKSAVALYRNVRQGGPWDLQRSYNGQSRALFASVFTNAASYAYGLIGAAAGFSTTTLMAAAGGYNAVMNPKTAGPNFGNNANNPPFISKGIRDFFDSSYGLPATIPDNSFQGIPAIARSIDRLKTTFDRSLKGASDDANRLTASAAIGNITPSVGFLDPTSINRYAGPFPQALASVTSSGHSGWLSSMLRNGEVERFIRDKAVPGPPVAASPNDSAAFDNRFGEWGTSPAGIAASLSSDGPASFDRRFGTWSTVPAGGLSDTRSPVLRELEKYRRSGALDRPRPTSVQGGPTPAFQPEAVPGGPRPARYQLRRVSSAFPNVTPRDPGQPEPAPLPGILSGEPISPLPHAVWGLPERSGASPRAALSEFLAGLTRKNPARRPPDDPRGFDRDQAQA